MLDANSDVLSMREIEVYANARNCTRIGFVGLKILSSRSSSSVSNSLLYRWREAVMLNVEEVRLASWRRERNYAFGFSYTGNPPSK